MCSWVPWDLILVGIFWEVLHSVKKITVQRSPQMVQSQSPYKMAAWQGVLT